MLLNTTKGNPLSSQYLSDLEKKGYGYDPLSGQAKGPVNGAKYVYNPKTGKYDPK